MRNESIYLSPAIRVSSLSSDLLLDCRSFCHQFNKQNPIGNSLEEYELLSSINSDLEIVKYFSSDRVIVHSSLMMSRLFDTLFIILPISVTKSRVGCYSWLSEPKWVKFEESLKSPIVINSSQETEFFILKEVLAWLEQKKRHQLQLKIDV